MATRSLLNHLAINKIEKRSFLIALATFFILTSLSAYTFHKLSEKENAVLDMKMDVDLKNISKSISENVEPIILSLRRMADRFSAKNGISRDDWEKDANNYIKHHEVFQALEWVNKEFVVQWIVPLKGNEKAQNLNLAFESNRKIALIKSGKTGEIVITDPANLIQGETGFLILIPVYEGATLKGFIVGVFKTQKLLDLSTNNLKDYKITLLKDNRVLATSYNDIQRLNGHQRTSVIKWRNTNWSIKLEPSKVFIETHKTVIPQISFFIGSILSILTSLLVFFVLQSKKQSIILKEKSDFLEKANSDLATSNRDLEQFAYIASHDLQEPPRS